MVRERYRVDDPREWLNRARSDLALSHSVPGEDVYLEDLCYHAQQAAEKALKAVLLHQKVDFPYTHNVAELLELVAASGVAIPQRLTEAERLNDYAVTARYPGVDDPVEATEHREAVALAREVVEWSEDLLESG